jgi:acetyl esterase/lipase/3-dehydroquinate dehydratase
VRLLLVLRRGPERDPILDDIETACAAFAAEFGCSVDAVRVPGPSEMADPLRESEPYDGVVCAPGDVGAAAGTLRAALVDLSTPAVVVHPDHARSDAEANARGRLAEVCAAAIYGRGPRGYTDAIRHLVERAARPVTTLAYGPNPNQIGDLRTPTGPGPFPLLVVLHGGFWAAQWTRDLMDAVSNALTDRGFATWNLEYRRVGAGGGWPQTLGDVARAFDFVPELPANVDLSRVAALGHSAGGHLALWAAARRGLVDDDPGGPPEFLPTAVVALAPVADLAAAWRADLGPGAVESFLGPPSERYEVASPAQRLPLEVPQALVHGDADDRVPFDQSVRYTQQARAAGDPIELFALPGTDHFAVIEPRSEVWPEVIRAVEWALEGDDATSSQA